MKLGILINTGRNNEAVIGITRAALQKGHDVSIFVMDEGTRLLKELSGSGFCESKGLSISYCDHSSKELGVTKDGIHGGIVCGSQYNNASMAHNSDKVIVL